MRHFIRLLRQFLDVVLLLLVVAVLGLVLIANVGPGLGHQAVVIRGGSMSPAIPLGALVDVVKTPADQIRPGDVVTLKAPNGTLVTHRVVRLATLPDGVYFETKGDANDAADPVLEPASSMQGRVAMTVPGLGFLMYMLTIPTGIASIFCLAITLLMAIWLLEEFEEDEIDEDAAEAGLEGELYGRSGDAAVAATLVPAAQLDGAVADGGSIDLGR